MKTETIKRIKLTASKGMVLTDGEDFGEVIFPSDTARVSDYREISRDMYEKMQLENLLIADKGIDVER